MFNSSTMIVASNSLRPTTNHCLLWRNLKTLGTGNGRDGCKWTKVAKAASKPFWLWVSTERVFSCVEIPMTGIKMMETCSWLAVARNAKERRQDGRERHSFGFLVPHSLSHGRSKNETAHTGNTTLLFALNDRFAVYWDWRRRCRCFVSRESV